MNKYKVGFFFSLRTQLWLGPALLLGATVAAISYALILNQEKTLTREMENSVVLQGRNIALSSEKALLRADPEFELFPLVKRILDQQNSVLSVTVVDAEGIVQGDKDIVNVGKPQKPVLDGYAARRTPNIHGDEDLYASEDSYVFRTPVLSMGKPIGNVFLKYSKQELRANIAKGVRITLLFGAASLFLGLILASLFFRHISRPMQAMLEGVNELAGGNLDTTIKVPTRNEFRILADSFNDMAFRIAVAQKEHIIKERMDRELEIARDIQHTLIPENVSAPRDCEIGHYYESATEVGGDYLDVIPISRSRVGLVLADVSGKGVPGLVVMAMVKIMVQNLVAKGVRPMEIVRKLNSALLGNIRRNMFVTFLIAVFDGETGSVVFSNAGHNPVVIYDRSSDQARFFRMAGPPMGTFPDEYFAEHIEEYDLVLRPGDMFLMYTDGLNESMNTRGEQFSLNRIMEIANRHASKGAASTVDRLVEAEKAFRGIVPRYDDITLLAVSMNAKPGGKKEEQAVYSHANSNS